MWDMVIPSAGEGGGGSVCEIGAISGVDTCDGEKNSIGFFLNCSKILCPKGVSHTGTTSMVSYILMGVTNSS
jgi:hypothetical protein